MGRKAWLATVHGGHKESDTTEQLSTMIHFAVQQELIQHCKSTILQLKKFFFKKNSKQSEKYLLKKLCF